uniref:Gamma-glutamyltranspeptidase 1 n=1 Tax=Parastrongyloides trichosuri TaxID=131310 RepID=A0A0N5A496_PARTI
MTITSKRNESVNMTFNENKKTEKYKKQTLCFKSVALVAIAIAFVFFLTTVGLGIIIGMKINSDSKEIRNFIHEKSNKFIFSNVTEIISNFSASTTSSHDILTTTSMKVENTSFDWPKSSGSMYAKYKKAAIVSENGLCSEIGRDILLQGGNAVDSAIATLFCLGVVNPQSSGLGGGFFMTFYSSKTKKCVTLDARETTPMEIDEKSFFDDPKSKKVGWKSISVPGELHGLWTAYKNFGSEKVNWTMLIEPSILLAKNGFPVSSKLASSLKQKKKEIMENEDLKKIFLNTNTGELYNEGEFMKRHELSNTLYSLSHDEDPINLFYRQGIAQTIVEEIREKEGFISLKDMENYETKIYNLPIEIDGLPDNLKMCGPPPPSSFVLTQAIIMIMSKFYSNTDISSIDDPLIYHRLIEIEKFVFAQRYSLGDLDFVETSKSEIKKLIDPAFYDHVISSIKNKSQSAKSYSALDTFQIYDHGTSHITIMDSEGNGVSCSSSINQLFGSFRTLTTLGIIFNNQMHDFSLSKVMNNITKVSINNIKPGKRSMSSMSPIITYNKNTGDIKTVIGASGGPYIISSIAQTIIRNLLFNQTLKESIDAPRFHNQYKPFVTEYESSTPKELIEILQNKYNQKMIEKDYLNGAVQAIQKNSDGYIYGNSDFRNQNSIYLTGY